MNFEKLIHKSPKKPSLSTSMGVMGTLTPRFDID